MNIWDQLVDCICRPPRDVYSPHELLGGLNQTFLIGQMECTRIDYDLTNKQGLKLVCSHYLPLDAKSQDGKLPVVVYCHCNSGSRRDAEEAVYHLLPCGVGVVAFDFTGSGLSDGKWVTLGAHEVEDLAVVVQHLRAQGGISSIGLWGRSMGAVTALLYSHMDPDIAGMVLDSPFSRLTDLMLEIVVSQRLPIPRVMLKLALRLMRNSVRRKAGADINQVSPLDVVARAVIPAMFGHGEEDSFINLQHSVKLYEAYNSAAAVPVYKNLVRFKGDHNHPRPSFFYSSVCCFFHQQLQLDQVLLGGNPADTQQLMQYGSLTLSAASEPLDRANGFINTPWSLEPVASMTPDEHAAAAAAAAAMLADESMNGGGLGSNCGGGAGSSAGGAACPQLTVSSRPGRQSSGSSPRQGGAGVVHISEGGLNSPRASAARQRRGVLHGVDAAGSSNCNSSRGGAASGSSVDMAPIRCSCNGGTDFQQLGSGGASSPVSHSSIQQQQHRQQQRSRHQEQQRHSSSLAGSGMMPQMQAGCSQRGVQQELSWHLPAATAAAAAAAAGSRSVPGMTPRLSNEALFSIGSRGAAAEVTEQPGEQGGVAITAFPAADPGVIGGGDGAGAAAKGAFSSSHHLKWLFKRNSSSSSAAGVTPSTSPQAAEGGHLWRSKSAGSSLVAGQQQSAATSPAATPPITKDVDQQPEMLLQQQHQHQHQYQYQYQRQQQHQHSRSVGFVENSGIQPLRGAAAAAAGSSIAAADSRTGRTPGIAAAPAAALGSSYWGPGLQAGADDPAGADGDEAFNADLAAAIAASLADQQLVQQQQQPPVRRHEQQQQQQQLGQQPSQPRPQQQHQQQQPHSTRLPHSSEEEERMLREAIALSLSLSELPQQQHGQEQQQGAASLPQQPPPQQEQHQSNQSSASSSHQQQGGQEVLSDAPGSITGHKQH